MLAMKHLYFALVAQLGVWGYVLSCKSHCIMSCVYLFLITLYQQHISDEFS
uniref:Uncharacterized protein n=1 Tax=Arundo donax TaxID=35708 RepID=A0A0A9A450_ARUDO